MRDLPLTRPHKVHKSTAPYIEVLSGLGEKGPACIRLWTGKRTWILDAGFGPEASSPFDPAWLEGADEVFITHDHIDHIGGAAHVISTGLPIACTAQTARSLPPGAKLRLLPEQGEVVIDGVRLRTGRNGHALGGVWLHFDLGQGGLFYSGDWSVESTWFAFDPPPPAQTALIDASYHLDDTPQPARRAALDAVLDALPGDVQVMLPVPPSGRAGEMALHLLPRGSVSLDDSCRSALASALRSGGVTKGAAALQDLVAQPFDPAARYLICDTPNADGGMAWQLVRDWRDQGLLGTKARVIFTGHMTAHARAICESGGQFLRWNVHPPLRDQRAMLQHLGARRMAPLFCAAPEDYLLEMPEDCQVLLGGRTLL